MTARFRASAAGAALVLGLAGGAPAARAEAPDVEARFRRGVELYNEADFRSAAAEFRRAYETSGNYKVLYNLAQCEHQLTEYAGAYATLERYLVEAGDRLPETRRREVDAQLDELRARTAAVAFVPATGGAVVVLDGRELGAAPLAHAVRVDAGRHVVAARGPGAAEVRVAFDVTVGEAREVDLGARSAPAEGPAAPARAPAPPAAPPPRGASYTPAIVAWGVSSALGVAGVRRLVRHRGVVVVDAVRAFAPDVVLVIGTNEGVAALLEPLEQAWGRDAAVAPPRPTYVLSDGLKSSALTQAIVRDEARGGTGLRARVSGTAPGRPNATTEAFCARFEPTYGAENSKTFGTAGAYDATYVVLYALAASLDAAPTGASIAQGIRRLVGGERLDVGPDGVGGAFRALGSGGRLDLEGASSPLDFDATGESPADIEVWCVSPSVRVPTFATTGLYFDAAANEMRGTFDCR